MNELMMKEKERGQREGFFFFVFISKYLSGKLKFAYSISWMDNLFLIQVIYI